MTIIDQFRDEKLQDDINREAAKISDWSSNKIHKYECLTGEDILLSNQQHIIEQAKFTYSPLGKAFEKQTKTIEDQGKNQVEALEDLKPKEQTEAIESKCNNQSKTKTKTMFNDLSSTKKSVMNKLYQSVDYNNLKFDYVGSTKDVSFFEYMDSRKHFNKIKNNKISFDDAQKRKKKFVKELSGQKNG